MPLMKGLNKGWRRYQDVLFYRVVEAHTRTIISRHFGITRMKFPRLLVSWNGQTMRVCELTTKWYGPKWSKVAMAHLPNLLITGPIDDGHACVCFGTAQRDVQAKLIDPLDAFFMTGFNGAIGDKASGYKPKPAHIWLDHHR